MFAQAYLKKRFHPDTAASVHIEPMYWISGPAFCGKSTLIQQYAKTLDTTCFTFSCSTRDTLVADFCQRLAQEVQQQLQRTLSLPSPSDETLSAYQWFKALADGLKSCFVIFDDYQNLPAQTERFLWAGIQHLQSSASLSSAVRVAIVSRHEPADNTVELQASGQLRVLNWPMLRHDAEEFAEVLATYGHPFFNEALCHTVHALCDGWIGAIPLLPLAHLANNHRDVLEYERSYQKVHAFFERHVFSALNSTTRTLLRDTAFVPFVTPAMADELSKHDNTAAILADLRHRNAFVFPAEVNPDGYVYHPLFRRFLKTYARSTLATDALEVLQKRSVNVLTQCIQQPAMKLVDRGQYEILAQWLAEIPDALMVAEPVLLFWRAMAHIPVSPNEAANDFEAAFSLYQEQGCQIGMLEAVTWAIVANLSEGSRLQFLDHWFSRGHELCLRHLDHANSAISGAVDQLIPLLFTALRFRPQASISRDETAKYLTRTQELLGTSKDRRVRTYCCYGLLFYHSRRGDLGEQTLLMKTLNRLLEHSNPFEQIIGHAGTALYYFLAGDTASAMKHADNAYEIAVAANMTSWVTQAQGVGAAAALSAGDPSKTEDYLGKMGVVWAENPHDLDEGYFHMLQAWQWLQQKDFDQAVHTIDRSITADERAGLSGSVMAYSFLLKAQTLSHSITEAQLWIQKAYNIAEQNDSAIFRFLCHLSAAAIYQKTGDSEHLHKELRAMLRIGREHKYINWWLWWPEQVSQLCEEALRQGIEIDYVQYLIRQRELRPSDRAAVPVDWPRRIHIYTLGGFRIERDGNPLSHQELQESRPLAFLKAVTAAGGVVDEEDLVDHLYRGSKNPSSYLSVNLNRLRKLLQVPQALLFERCQVKINNTYCWVDAFAFEALCNAIKSSKGKHNRPAINRAIELYRDPFLPDEVDHWSEQKREKLEHLWDEIKCLG